MGPLLSPAVQSGAPSAQRAGVLTETRGGGYSRSRTPGCESAHAVPLPGPAPPHPRPLITLCNVHPCNVASLTALTSMFIAASQPPHKMQASRTAERLLTGPACSPDLRVFPVSAVARGPGTAGGRPQAQGHAARPPADTAGHHSSRNPATATHQRPGRMSTHITCGHCVRGLHLRVRDQRLPVTGPPEKERKDLSMPDRGAPCQSDIRGTCDRHGFLPTCDRRGFLPALLDVAPVATISGHRAYSPCAFKHLLF